MKLECINDSGIIEYYTLTSIASQTRIVTDSGINRRNGHPTPETATRKPPVETTPTEAATAQTERPPSTPTPHQGSPRAAFHFTHSQQDFFTPTLESTAPWQHSRNFEMTLNKRHVASAARHAALSALAKRLRAAREHAELTHQAAAEHLGVRTQTLRNWEAGRNEPEYGKLTTLASLYGLHTDHFTADTQPFPLPSARDRPGLRIKFDPSLLVQARKEAPVSQAETARRSGFGTSSIRRYELDTTNDQDSALPGGPDIRKTTLLAGPRTPRRSHPPGGLPDGRRPPDIPGAPTGPDPLLRESHSKIHRFHTPAAGVGNPASGNLPYGAVDGILTA